MIGLSLTHVAAVAVLGAAVISPVCLPDAGTAAPAGAVSSVSAADTVQVRLNITGMTCGGCALTARIVLERTPGVFEAEVSYEEATATVWYDDSVTTTADVIARLEEYTDYEATVAEDDEE
jgi:copper chaperone